MRKLSAALFVLWLITASIVIAMFPVAMAGTPDAGPAVHEKSVAAVAPELVAAAPELVTVVKAKAEVVPVAAEVKVLPAVVADTSPWHVTLVNALIAFLFATLTACIPVLTRYMIKKYQLDISNAQAQELDALLVKGAHYAEERAAVAVKTGLPKIASNQKLDMAVSFVVDGMKAAGLPEKGEDALKKLVEARLGYYGDMGATVGKDDPSPLPKA